MKVFNRLAEYYDLIYSFKNYEAESKYIHQLIKKYSLQTKDLLNLGCGTGNHDFFLQEKGYAITGIDLSKPMIAKAKAKSKKKQIPLSKLSFLANDILTTRLPKKFDAVISLFYALNYFTTKTSMKKAIGVASNHLSSGGLFIFDSWYKPAVLHLKPQKKTYKFEYLGWKAYRTNKLKEGAS